MALDAEDLAVWDISFRWAGHDPSQLWFRIPLSVRDNFQVLMNAILSGEIICQTLCLDKLPHGSRADPKFYIRTHIDDVYDCIHGLNFKRSLLKWAILERRDFFDWCSCRGIQLPEFWFPPGWKYKYEHPEDFWPGLAVRHKEPGDENTIVSFGYDWPVKSPDNTDIGVSATTEATSDVYLRKNQAVRLVCRQIASVIWQRDPTRRIAEVIRDDLIQEFGGAKYFVEDTVREWIKDLAPPEVRTRRGRPRKENGAQSEKPAIE